MKNGLNNFLPESVSSCTADATQANPFMRQVYSRSCGSCTAAWKRLENVSSATADATRVTSPSFMRQLHCRMEKVSSATADKTN
jgi:hypothetical protein